MLGFFKRQVCSPKNQRTHDAGMLIYRQGVYIHSIFTEKGASYIIYDDGIYLTKAQQQKLSNGVTGNTNAKQGESKDLSFDANADAAKCR